MINRKNLSRREHSRVRVNWPVVIVSDQSTIKGRIVNLSRGGALLYLKEQVPQEAIRVAIEIPDYNNAISTECDIVRTYLLEEDMEPCPYAMGVKFVDLLPQDLGFFNGDLATESRNTHGEQTRLPQLGSAIKDNIGYIFLGALVLVVMIATFLIFSGGDIESRKITVLERRLKNVESQIKALSELTASNRHVKNQLLDIQTELSILKADIVPIAPETPDTEQIVPAYHLVKKGDNLFRIGLRYGLNTKELQKLNNLSSSDFIHPDQKLLVTY